MEGIHGYVKIQSHLYISAIGTMYVLAEQLYLQKEHGDPHDEFTVAVIMDY